MSDVATSLRQLAALADDFRRGQEEFPHLYYAILEGEAFKETGGWAELPDGSRNSLEKYIMETVADDFEVSLGWGWKPPRHFFFGRNLLAARKRLNSLTQIGGLLLREGLDMVHADLSADSPHTDRLPEDWRMLDATSDEVNWVLWMDAVGRQEEDPLLKIFRVPGRVDRRFYHSPSVAVPTRDGEQCLIPFWGNALHSVPHPLFEMAVEAIEKGRFQSVGVHRTPLFYASRLFIDRVVARARRLHGLDEANSKPAAVTTPAADPDGEWLSPGEQALALLTDADRKRHDSVRCLQITRLVRERSLRLGLLGQDDVRRGKVKSEGTSVRSAAWTLPVSYYRAMRMGERRPADKTARAFPRKPAGEGKEHGFCDACVTTFPVEAGVSSCPRCGKDGLLVFHRRKT